MISIDYTILIQVVNFLILLLVLNLVMFRPIRRLVKQRTDKMSALLTDIENFHDMARKKTDDYEQALDKARQEGGEVKNSKKSEAVQEESNILAQANEEASKELEAARQEISSQAEAARQDLSGQINEYAEMVAKKLLVS